MVVNADSQWKEQVNHYYAYGSLIGDISTKPDEQNYKYSGKVLAAKRKIDNLSARRRALARVDRAYGLDLYDFLARQYDPIGPGFTSIDPLAEKYYGISPYAYCAGDPVNCVDPDGRKVEYAAGTTDAFKERLQKNMEK